MGRDYWQGAREDAAMQDEHRFIWDVMLDSVDVPLKGARVLDAGCNRGGFLRLLADRHGIAQGYGFDPALGAIADARRMGGDRPLHFAVAATVPEGWRGLDLAFSHEVLYLLHDLVGHARALYDALRPGGVYFAVTGVHTGSPLMEEFHRENAGTLGLPNLYEVDDVLATFAAAGFDVAVGRLPFRFVPVVGHGHHDHGRMLDWLDYYYEQKLMVRAQRPEARADTENA